jgi:hypothetical protein
MNIPSLLEAKSNFRRFPIFGKVENYICIANQWLLTYSKKVLEQVHGVTQQLQRAELERYLDIGKEWLLETPERALAHAYDTAVILKKIEDEYFDGNPAISIENYSDGVSSYFHLVLRKSLFLIQVRLVEFKASYAIINGQSLNELENNSEHSSILKKLQLINEVLVRYQVQPTSASTPANDSPFTPEPVIEISEPGTYNQPSESGTYNQPHHQWEFLESLLLDFAAEDNSQVSQESNQVSRGKTTVEMRSQSSQLHPRLIGYLASNAGFASLVFAGGLTIGGLSSWLLLSTQNQTDDRSKCLRSTQVNPDYAQLEMSNLSLTVKPSPPEVLRPESSAAAIYLDAYELF